MLCFIPFFLVFKILLVFLLIAFFWIWFKNCFSIFLQITFKLNENINELALVTSHMILVYRFSAKKLQQNNIFEYN